MTIIGCEKEITGSYTFYCRSDAGFYSFMTVNNVGGAIDMTNRVPKMTYEQFLSLKGE